LLIKTKGEIWGQGGEHDDNVPLDCDVALTSKADTNISEKHSASIFRTKDDSVPNETKVSWNRSDQFSASLRNSAVGGGQYVKMINSFGQQSRLQ
jgi:hypothetical protein